ncbi:MAG: hypothetical protein MJY70_04890, partial [Bacteroidales bacterium]|nr:hypothetical protein [Bacteroidales bacterium]
FWADHVEQTTEAGLQIDNYYDTRTNGLKAVALKGSYAGNIDARDAFALCKEYTIAQAGSAFQAVLKRPFAQINVITTDVATVAKVSALKPEKVNVVLKNAVKVYNVLDSTAVAGSTGDLTYTENIYNWDASKQVCTLSMDYIFAEKEKGVIDIDWKAKKTGDTDVEHAFAAVPYQRNFRTNIKGALLTTQGQWTVEVDPIWDSMDDGSKDINVDYTEVNNASEVKDAIKSKTEDTNKDGQGLSVIIKDEVGTGEVNDDIIIPDNTPKETTPEIILDFKKLSANAQIVIRDEQHPRDAQEANDGAIEYPGEVVVIVPEGTKAEQVKILTNKSTVTVRGEYGTVIASCAPQTIIVEKGTVIGILEVMKGNVEVYGKVTSIVNKTAESDASKDVVFVYLFQGSTWTKVESEKNAKLVPLYPVAKIVDKYYFSVEDAVASVKDGDVITLVSDVTLNDKLLINGGKNFTLDLGGKILTGRVNVDGAKLVVKNGTIDAGTFKQALNFYGSKDPMYKDGIYTYVKVEKDVILKGTEGGLCFLSINGSVMYPLSYGVKVDFYGKAQIKPAQVSGNIGYDNYEANIGNVDISANLPAGISSPSKAMSLYGPIVNIYGEMRNSSADNEKQGFILSGMARVNVYEGALIEGAEGIGMKSGSLHVYGGTIKSTGAKIDPVEAVNSGAEASGAAISITSSYTFNLFEDKAEMLVNIEGGDLQAINNSALLVTHSYKDSKPVALKQGVDLAISGGKFTSGSDVPVVFIDNAAEGDEFAMPAKFISGGLYNKAPEAGYIADGKKAVQNTQGHWEIVIDELAIVNGVKYASVGEAIKAAKTGDVINVYGTTDFTKAADGFCYTDDTNKKGRLVLVELVNEGSTTTNATLKVNTAPSVNSMTFQTLWLGSESRLDSPGSYLKSGDVLVLPAKTMYLQNGPIYDMYGDITLLGKKGKTVIKPWGTPSSSGRFFRLYNRYKKNIEDNVIYHFNFKDVIFDGELKNANENLFVVTCYNIQINMDGCIVKNFPGSVFSIWANDALSDSSFPTREDNVGVEVNITNSTLTENGRLVRYDCIPTQSDVSASLDKYGFIHVNYDANSVVNCTEMYNFNEVTAKGQGNCLLNGVDVWPADN